MSKAVRNALVVGGGIGGMSAAISLRQRNVQVDLVDIDPEWRVYGAGLTITGPTLRAFHRLGILEDVRASGFFSQEVKFFTAAGACTGSMPVPVLEAGIPATGGIMRPNLHRILSQKTRALGTDIRLGVTLDRFSAEGDAVEVVFSDGSARRYDAVIGADGVHSKLRQTLFPQAPSPEFTGQGCWRVTAPRPAEVVSPELYFGPNHSKVGFNPCSPDQLYLFATVSMPGNPHIPQDELLPRIADILAPFAGRIADIRGGLDDHSEVIYRPLEALLLPPPWHVGAVGLIGDAVHATTPHLACGAGLSVEDGVLLGEAMSEAESAAQAWENFEQRRWERCRMVVENSLLIGRLELAGGHDADVARLMAESAAALAGPM